MFLISRSFLCVDVIHRSLVFMEKNSLAPKEIFSLEQVKK